MFGRMFGAVVLAAAILLPMSFSGGASGQTKKDDKTAKTDAKTGAIEITKGKDDKFRFFVRDAEGKLLAMSGPGGFATTKDAQAAIDKLKEVVAKAKVSVGDKKGK